MGLRRSLDEPPAWNYIFDAKSAEPTLKILRQERHSRIGFFGHIHQQGIFPDAPDALEWLEATRVKIPDATACAVMVGSVGQPRHETDHRAAWVIWDPASRVVDFRKTDF